MAIAESPRIGIFHRVAERPILLTPAFKLEISTIKEIPQEEIEKLAQIHFMVSYQFSEINRTKMTDWQTTLLGVTEIQALTLTMLGQKHLLGGQRPTAKDIKPPKQIGEREIRKLAQRYILAKDKEKYMGSVSKTASPEQARIKGNAMELARVLVEFGQEKIIEEIDRKIDGPRIDWAKMRSTGNGDTF